MAIDRGRSIPESPRPPLAKRGRKVSPEHHALRVMARGTGVEPAASTAPVGDIRGALTSELPSRIQCEWKKPR